MFKQLEEESGHGGRDSYEEVYNDEENVGGARNFKPERGWIHDGSYGPAEENKIKDKNTNITDQTWYWHSFLNTHNNEKWEPGLIWLLLCNIVAENKYY